MLASMNVSTLVGRADGLLDWMHDHSVDVVGLEETRTGGFGIATTIGRLKIEPFLRVRRSAGRRPQEVPGQRGYCISAPHGAGPARFRRGRSYSHMVPPHIERRGQQQYRSSPCTCGQRLQEEMPSYAFAGSMGTRGPRTRSSWGDWNCDPRAASRASIWASGLFRLPHEVEERSTATGPLRNGVRLGPQIHNMAYRGDIVVEASTEGSRHA